MHAITPSAHKWKCGVGSGQLNQGVERHVDVKLHGSDRFGMRLERMDEAQMDWAFQVMPFLFTVFFFFLFCSVSNRYIPLP